MFLLLCLCVVQLMAAVLVAIVMLVLALTGIVPLVGPTPLWGWIVSGVLVCLLWLGMGRLTSCAVRPGAVETVAVLVIWAGLTVLLSNMPLLFYPQDLCGGMLEQLLGIQDHSSWLVRSVVPCLLLSAVFGAGLFWGWKTQSTPRSTQTDQP